MTPAATPHAPLGARASFDFGPAGAPAGFAQPAGHPPAAEVMVGCRPSPRDAWALLPFFTPVPGGPAPLPKGRFGRFLAWAGDKWMIGPLVFKLCTPFDDAPANDGDRFRHAPVVCGYLEYDNTHSADVAELVFALRRRGAPLASPGLAGFGFDGRHGFATAASDEAAVLADDALFGVGIGAAAGLKFSVPAHAKRIFPLVLGFHEPGFFYGSLFTDLAAVLDYGLAQHARYLAASDARDAEFMRSTLAFDRKAVVAMETRAWLAGTHRLAGEPPVDLTPLHQLSAAVAGRA